MAKWTDIFTAIPRGVNTLVNAYYDPRDFRGQENDRQNEELRLRREQQERAINEDTLNELKWIAERVQSGTQEADMLINAIGNHPRVTEPTRNAFLQMKNNRANNLFTDSNRGMPSTKPGFYVPSPTGQDPNALANAMGIDPTYQRPQSFWGNVANFADPRIDSYAALEELRKASAEKQRAEAEAKTAIIPQKQKELESRAGSYDALGRKRTAEAGQVNSLTQPKADKMTSETNRINTLTPTEVDKNVSQTELNNARAKSLAAKSEIDRQLAGLKTMAEKRAWLKEAVKSVRVVDPLTFEVKITDPETYDKIVGELTKTGLSLSAAEAMINEAGTTQTATAQQPQAQGKSMTATNPKTGEKIISNDGGKTWQKAQ